MTDDDTTGSQQFLNGVEQRLSDLSDTDFADLTRHIFEQHAQRTGTTVTFTGPDPKTAAVEALRGYQAQHSFTAVAKDAPSAGTTSRPLKSGTTGTADEVMIPTRKEHAADMLRRYHRQ